MKKGDRSKDTEGRSQDSAFGWLENPWIGALLCAVLGFVAFQGSISNGFVFFDDDQAILYNQALQQSGLAGFFSGQNLGMYAPMTWIFYAIGTSISGEEAWGHHLLGVLLHCINAAVLFLALRELFGRSWPALFAAGLFAVHPVQTEAVAWAAALSTVLFASFYLGSLYTYIRWRKGATLPWILVSFGLFILACLSKSAAVTLPLVLVAVDYFLDKKQAGKLWLSKIPYFLSSLIFGIYTFVTRAREGHDMELASSTFDALDRFWMISQTILFYPYKLLVPSGFSIAYPFVKDGDTWPLVYYLAPVILAGLAFAVWKFWRQSEDKLFAIALYILPLAVMLPFRTVGSFELRSDRYVYVSCAGIFLLIALLLERLDLKIRLGVLGVACLIGIYLSRQQSQVWNNGVALFENCVEKTPDAALCQCNLGYNELIRLDFDGAVEHYSNTLRLDPTYVEAYNGRGQAYFNLQKVNEAYSDFNSAINSGLSSPKLFMNRGKCLVMTGKMTEAIPDFNKSLELEPMNPEVYFFRGFCHERAGQLDQAMADYGKAIEQNPKYMEPLVNRGLLHYNNNKYEEAIADYTAALQINPNLAMALNNRANAYYLTNQLPLALADASKCIETNPGYIRAYETRARIHQKMGNLFEASEDLRRLKELQKQPQ